jgi:2-polyprenyl-6-methoxyphenol hydroxylase-like FAD-dependent oxidoreductase
MTSLVGNRVVVLGGSLAGLLAARVLAPVFTEVVLVDRDDLIGVSGPRRGVPHGRHAHGLVARGQQILESHFPGLTDDLITAGVKPGDFNGDIRWYVNGTRMRPSRSGLLSVPATRPVLEEHLRQRIQQLPNVVFKQRHDILGLAASADGARVTGARVQAHGGAAEVLEADLVIDTTGRGSRTPVWLEELGYARPEEERVKIGLAYTTRHFKMEQDPFGSDLAIIPAPTPQQPRGAFFYRVPGEGVTELSLTGMLGDHPPADPDGFLAFARSLPVPQIYEAIRDAEPIDDAVTFRFPASVWRHYERMTRFPAGLLVMGDAVCSFNPLYAQGMTVAAMESVTLGEQLAGGVPEPLGFLRAIARDIAMPWDFSVGADLAYPAVEGRRSLKTRFANAYVSRLQRGAARDAELTNAFIRAAGLIDPPQALMRPRIALRVLRSLI